jgi:hypothetical protein
MKRLGARGLEAEIMQLKKDVSVLETDKSVIKSFIYSLISD